jgi:hypothetical protein
LKADTAWLTSIGKADGIALAEAEAEAEADGAADAEASWVGDAAEAAVGVDAMAHGGLAGADGPSNRIANLRMSSCETNSRCSGSVAPCAAPFK